jgi:hypothetical protein
VTDQHRTYFERNRAFHLQDMPRRVNPVFSDELLEKAKEKPKGWFRSFFWAKLLGKKVTGRDGTATVTAYRYRGHLYVTESTP